MSRKRRKIPLLRQALMVHSNWRPDHVRGTYTSAEGTQEIYYNLRFPFIKRGDSIWRTGYSIREYDGRLDSFLRCNCHYQKNKKKMTVTEKGCLCALLSTDDVKIWLASVTNFPRRDYSFLWVWRIKRCSRSFKVALSVSKDSFKPLSITYTSHKKLGKKKTMDLKQQITYSKLKHWCEGRTWRFWTKYWTFRWFKQWKGIIIMQRLLDKTFLMICAIALACPLLPVNRNSFKLQRKEARESGSK